MLGMRTRFINDGVIPDQRVVDRIVSVSANQDIDTVNLTRKFLIVAQAAVRNKYD